MIIKHAGDKHFTKNFNCGAWSDRVVLPGPDGVRPKVNHLFGPVGAEWEHVSYLCDETVIIISGAVTINRGNAHVRLNDIVRAGGCYVVPAGESYTLTALEEVEIWCVFSQAGSDGPPVDNT